ncbi:hypothetical protein UCDDA912_g03428 [Diaporthe ampelina]|uniref:Uncharacterized protein n=1 Tax=Diaporthe ampelina TaxID=1214573 RepID=A0A0G2HNL2_9PEZI|nr:hypothetical protein UCDDA912_g03428 [Diaporthe ampelina]
MAADLPLALRRTPRRRQQLGVDEAPRTPAPASQRKSSRASAARKQAITKTTTPRMVDKAATSKSRASIPVSATAAAGTDDATDDSITLVDDADDSITALDFDIPISSQRVSAGGTGKRKRRPSVTSPARNPAIKRVRRHQPSSSHGNDTNASIVRVLPLRTQILDDHIKRRIRRNGLSEEMNEAYGEKRARRQRTLAELRRARDELRSRDAEIERLRELTALFDASGDRSHHRGEGEEEASRMQDLERELSRLREQVMGRRRGDDVPLSSSPPIARDDDNDDDDGWGVMGSMSDGGSDAGGEDFAQDFDDEFGEASVAELESGGTPEQHHRQKQQQSAGRKPIALRLHGPALTPPSTSPAKLPSSPLRQIHSSGSSTAANIMTSSVCDAGVQATFVSVDASSQVCIPEPGMDELNDELSTLRAEVTSLNDTLLERDSLQARIREKMAQHQLPCPPSTQERTVEDQDVELQLDIVLQDLTDRTTRLAELSSLLMSSPTDSTTADDKGATAELASALHSVRQALGDLDPDTPLPPSAAPTLAQAADRLRELDTALKQRTSELSDRDAALAVRDEQLAASAARAAEKDARAANLESDVVHLGRTVASLRDEVEMLQEASASRQADLDDARATAAEAVAKLGSLGAKLAEREDALRGREGEIGTLRAALAEAQATVARLREGAARDRGASREAVRKMRAQMLAALRVGEGFLGDEGVAKEEEEGVDVVGVAGASAVDGSVDKAARGRSDDSGLGLDGEEPQLV